MPSKLTSPACLAALAERGYTPAIDFDVDNGNTPGTVKLAGAITFHGEDGFMDFHNAEKFYGITCDEFETLAFFVKDYALFDGQIRDLETGAKPNTSKQEEAFFTEWSAALEKVGIDLNSIPVQSR